MTSEFDLIRRYFTYPTKHTVLGVGDDAALLLVSDGMELAVSTDMLVAGRHFFPDADPQKLGHKALAVNLSDMAAMGAKPKWVTLSLALPDANEVWIAAFMQGFMDLAAEYDIDLVGGDTTRGPLNICVQIMGEIPARKALRRDAAKAGDDVWVSGHLGDAALVLAHLQRKIELDTHEVVANLPFLNTPQPRVALGQALLHVAHSAIDISDGLVADLGHIAARSQVSAVIELSLIPKSETIAKRMSDPIALQALLAGGDDYELCFTATQKNREQINALSRKISLPITRIGRIESGTGVVVHDLSGKPMQLKETGFDQFRN
jgi:thiamine-monophosphate kinase